MYVEGWGVYVGGVIAFHFHILCESKSISFRNVCVRSMVDILIYIVHTGFKR